MLRRIAALLLVSVSFVGMADAQDSLVCEGECQNIGVELEEFRIDVSSHGSSCDSWTFDIGPVQLDSQSDICPAIVRYRPECARQIPKEQHCVKRAWKDRVIVYQPQCTCVMSAFICLDWECLLGAPREMETIHCFGEAVCPKPAQK